MTSQTLWTFVVKLQVSKIESLQYNAALAITAATRRSSKEKLYQELTLEYLISRRWLRKLCLFYKIIVNKSPNYLPKANTTWFFVVQAVGRIISGWPVGKIIIIILSFRVGTSKNKKINHGVRETCAIMSTQVMYEINHISLHISWTDIFKI